MSHLFVADALASFLGFIMDPIISTFPKTLYTTDVMDSLKVSPEETSQNRGQC